LEFCFDGFTRQVRSGIPKGLVNVVGMITHITRMTMITIESTYFGFIFECLYNLNAGTAIASAKAILQHCRSSVGKAPKYNAIIQIPSLSFHCVFSRINYQGPGLEPAFYVEVAVA
jgi:hypothetical protein